jgi:c-di-GMP-binding flagellar brake protein YcgR
LRTRAQAVEESLMGSEKQRQAFRLDVNADINVQVENRRIKMRLMDISESGARFRSGLPLSPQSRILFNWLGPSREPIALEGRIVAARALSMATAEYGVKFDLPVPTRDRLARELLEMQRRRAFKPMETGAPRINDGEVGGRAKRQGYRATVQFPVSIRALKEGRWIRLRGEAQDLSMGGMCVAMPGNYEEDTELVLNFTLPLGEVNFGGEEKEEIEHTPFGDRKKKKIIPVRPFDPITAKARVVKKAPGARNGMLMFGTKFVDIDPFTKEEIARFVHAYQVGKLRKAAATQG